MKNMKIIVLSIISTLIMFSSITLTHANSGVIEDMFDINYGVEEYSLGLSRLEAASFANSGVQRTYDEFITLDQQLKSVFMSRYRSGEIDYYQMQDLISAYNNFVFYTSKTFQYISLEEKGFRGKETSRAITNSYTQMRQSYAKVQHILRK